jgi:hypothetical protein
MALSIGVPWTIRRMQARRVARDAAEATTDIAPWAASNGWRMVGLDEAHASSEILEALARAGEGGARRLVQVAIGELPGGRATVIDSWRPDGEGTIDTALLVATKATARPAAARVLDKGPAWDEAARADLGLAALPAFEPALPSDPELDLPKLIAGLAVGSEARLGNGQISLRVPERLTPERLTELLRVARAIDAALPRPSFGVSR